MNPKIIFRLLSLFLLFGIMTGCTNKAEESNIETPLENMSSADRIINVEKLEIYHFHGINQCYSCITVGQYAEDTVKTYFADELKSGKIIFGHINRDLSENRDLVTKYGATGSSIWLGAYKEGNFKAEEDINVWYKIRNKQDYMDYFKGVIEQKLAGN